MPKTYTHDDLAGIGEYQQTNERVYVCATNANTANGLVSSEPRTAHRQQR